MATQTAPLRPQPDEEIIAEFGGAIGDPELIREFGGTIQELPEDVPLKGLYTTAEGIPVYQPDLPPGVPGFQAPPSARFEPGMVPTPAAPGTARTGPDTRTWGQKVMQEGINVASQVESGIHQGISNTVWDLAAKAAALLEQGTNMDPEGGAGFYKKIEDFSRGMSTAHTQESAKLAGGRQDLPSRVIRDVTTGVASLPAYVGASVAMGPVLGPAAVAGLQTSDQPLPEMLKAMATGGAMAKFGYILGPAKRWIRVPLQMAVEYGRLKAAGVDDDTAWSNAIAQGVLEVPGGRGTVGPRKLPGHVARGVAAVPGEIVRGVAAVPREMIAALPPEVQARFPSSVRLTPQVFKGPLSPEAIANNQWLREQGVNVPPSLATGSKGLALAEAATKEAPGGGYAGEQSAAIGEQLTGVGRKLATELTPGEMTSSMESAGGELQTTLETGLQQRRETAAAKAHPEAQTAEQAGEAVIKGGQARIKERHEAASEAYGTAWEVDQVPDNYEMVPSGRVDDKGQPIMVRQLLPIDRGPLKQVLRGLVKSYTHGMSEMQKQASPALAMMREIIRAPRYVDIKTAEMDLGALKAVARTEGMRELRGRGKGLAAKTVEQLQQAIDARMAGAAYPGWSGEGESPALAGLREGRKQTAQKYAVEAAYKGLGKDITKLEPVGVFSKLTAAGDAGIQRLRQILRIAPEARGPVARAFIESGGDWRKLGDATKKELFQDPKLIRELDQYYQDFQKYNPLLKMEPVEFAESLLAPKGRANKLLFDIAHNAPKQMPSLGRAALEGWLDKMTREGSYQNVQSILNAVNEMDHGAKLLLFGTQERVRAVNELFFALKRLNHELNPSGTARVNSWNDMKKTVLKGAMSLFGAGAGFAGHGGGGATAGAAAGFMLAPAAEYGFNKFLGRMLYDPRYSKLLTEGIRLRLKGDTAGVEDVSGRLARMAQEEGLEPPEEPPAEPGEPPEGPGGGAGSRGPEGPAQGFIQNLREFLTDEEGSFPSQRGRPTAIQELTEGTRTLRITPTGAGGALLTSDVGQALENAVAGRFKLGADASPRRRAARALESMIADLRYALASDDGGRGWYTDDVKEMERILVENLPQFKDPAKRGLLKFLLGITSNGINPELNFDASLRGWDIYERDGEFNAYDRTRFSEESSHPQKWLGLTFRANSYKSAMERMTRLVNDKGEAGALEWLMTKHPVSELKQYYGDVPGPAGQMRYGAYIFGEKVGAFGLNLNGIHTELTADKWWSRTWNRWMGTMMDTDAEGNLKFDKKGNPLLQDDPRNEGERNLMRETAAKAADALGLTVAELQAVLWYAEQRLYRHLGIDASSVSYADAARRRFPQTGTGNVRRQGNAVNRGQAAGGRASPQPGEAGLRSAEVP